MKRYLLPLSFLFILTLLSSGFGADQWHTDYAKALALAAKTDQPVLLDFTGSDWCPPCMAITKEIFTQPEFLAFAKDHLVLVELDFPHNKPQLPAEAAQNENLAQKYNIEGFPTLVLLNSKGKEITRNVGYLSGGPQGFIDWFKSATK